MPKSPESYLDQAASREKDCEWLAAARLYDLAYAQIPKGDLFEKGQILEREGYALYRSAFQAGMVGEFGERTGRAADFFSKALESFEGSEALDKGAWASRCRAMTAYIGYWLARDASEKRKRAHDAWRLAREALEDFEKYGNAVEFVKTYLQLSSAAIFLFYLEWEPQAIIKTLAEGADMGERAITLLPRMAGSRESARAYSKTAFFKYTTIYRLASTAPQKTLEIGEQVKDYFSKGLALSKEDALTEMLTMPITPDYFFGSIENKLGLYGRALKFAERTNDNLLIGMAYDILSYLYSWRFQEIEDSKKGKEIADKALTCALEAQKRYSVISFTSPRHGPFWTGGPYSEYYELLTRCEIDPEKKHDYLERSVEYARELMDRVKSTGYSGAIINAHHVLSKVLMLLAPFEKNPTNKRKLLEESLEHRNETLNILEHVEHEDEWGRGVFRNLIGDIQAEMYWVEPDTEKRKSLLEEVFHNKDNGLRLCLDQALIYEKAHDSVLFSVLGRWQNSYGDFLAKLFSQTKNSEHQRKAIKAFDDAAASFAKKGLDLRMAECFWKIANGYRNLDDNLKAAENFALASRAYGKACEKMPNFKEYFDDHRLYMVAWNQITMARHSHSREDYASARKYYEKTARLHESIKRWGYLASNYLAWAAIEDAEDLSRREEIEKAKKSFDKATRLFNRSKKALADHLDRVEEPDEREMCKNLIDI